MSLKRHQVSDLFYGNHTEVAEGPWHLFDSQYPDKTIEALKNHRKIRVQLKNGVETCAYFYPDKCAWASMMYEPSYFWDTQTKEPLHDVVGWKLMLPKEVS